MKINDIIKILPGEKLPVDGIVIKGSSELDTSSLTGESIPLRVEENNQVISGSINMDGVLFIRGPFWRSGIALIEVVLMIIILYLNELYTI